MANNPNLKSKKTISFEESLWASANKQRGSLEPSEYKHIVLSLIFLKFINSQFENHRQILLDGGNEQSIEVETLYTQNNIVYLPEAARWQNIIKHSEQNDITLIIDTALQTIEKNHISLVGALTDKAFSSLGLEGSKLIALIDLINDVDSLAKKYYVSEKDLVGLVFEYFLDQFAAIEGKGRDEFYTPKSIVTLLTEMLKPHRGKIYNPCCGSGNMFVQSMKFIHGHNGTQQDIAIYGQEYTSNSYKLAKINLAIRGINGNLGDVAGDVFLNDQHPDLKADYIMANPPFNQKRWRGANELTDDPRWRGYTLPPTNNANYAWILHILSKLNEYGTAGLVLPNGSMSTKSSGEGTIRQEIINNDHIDCMIALPGQFFYTTQIPACLWFLTKNKEQDNTLGYRDRKGETLFIDARNMGSMINRIHREFTEDDVAKISGTYHAWRSEAKNSDYEDVPGYSKAASLEEIKANDYVLTPGRYVGSAEVEDDGVPFEEKMQGFSKKFFRQMKEAEVLNQLIRQNLGVLGYGE